MHSSSLEREQHRALLSEDGRPRKKGIVLLALPPAWPLLLVDVLAWFTLFALSSLGTISLPLISVGTG